MPVAKHLDPVVGLDMHMVQPPAPAPPLMLPIPTVGYLLDPADYSGGSTVLVNGLPAARAGTPGVAAVPHIAPGGVFVVPPADVCEMYQGSSTVVVDGDALAGEAHPVLSCHDVGMPAPVRAWRSAPTTSLMLVSAAVLPISSPPVNVGGPPTIAASGGGGTSSSGSTTPPTASLDVQVFGRYGDPLANARYIVRPLTGGPIEGRLDSEGKVSLPNLPGTRAQLVLPEIDAGQDPVAMPTPETPAPPSRAPAQTASTTAPPPAPPVAPRRTHTVRRGEGLDGIARAYSATRQQLMQWNQITNADEIDEGQTLFVEAPSANGTGAPPANATPTPSGPRARHTVTRGESLGGISNRYHVTVQDLMTWNNIRSPTALQAGQHIFVAPPTTPNATPPPAASGPMNHVALEAQTFRQIQASYGVVDWRLAFDAPANARLKARRNPNILYRRDGVAFVRPSPLPAEYSPPGVSVELGAARVVYVQQVQNVVLRLELVDVAIASGYTPTFTVATTSTANGRTTSHVSSPQRVRSLSPLTLQFDLDLRRQEAAIALTYASGEPPLPFEVIVGAASPIDTDEGLDVRLMSLSHVAPVFRPGEVSARERIDGLNALQDVHDLHAAELGQAPTHSEAFGETLISWLRSDFGC